MKAEQHRTRGRAWHRCQSRRRGREHAGERDGRCVKMAGVVRRLKVGRGGERERECRGVYVTPQGSGVLGLLGGRAGLEQSA
jgi:hypothetical protein